MKRAWATSLGRSAFSPEVGVSLLPQEIFEELEVFAGDGRSLEEGGA